MRTYISVAVEGRGIFQRDFVRLKFPNIDRGPSAANEQRTNVHKLRQLRSVCSRFEPRSLYKIVTHHDLCAKRLCLLFKAGRDIDGITDERWAKASRGIDGASPGLAVLHADGDRNRRTSGMSAVKAQRPNLFENFPCTSQRSCRAVGPVGYVRKGGQYTIALIRVELTFETRHEVGYHALKIAEQAEHGLRGIVDADPHEMVQVDEHHRHVSVTRRLNV